MRLQPLRSGFSQSENRREAVFFRLEIDMEDAKSMIHRDRYTIDTETFAKIQLVKPNTVRKELCLTGSWKGIRPLRTPGGRLIWPDVTVAELAEASHATT